MSLTDIAVRNAKPQDKPYQILDSESLYLKVEPSGSKSWLFRFYWKGGRKKRSLGPYPLVSIREARVYRDRAKKLLFNGILPEKENIINEGSDDIQNKLVSEYVAEWKTIKFEKLGLSTLTNRKSTASQISRYFDKDIVPLIGKMYLNQVDKTHISLIFKKIENRGALTVRVKVRAWLYELFQYAKAQKLVTDNPVTDDIETLFRQPLPIDNNPHLTGEQLPQFFTDFKQSKSDLQNQLGVKLLFLTGVRPGELRAATVQQFDFKNELWNIPPENVKQLNRLITLLEIEERMPNTVRAKAAKKRKEEIPPYIVPLSKQAIKVIKQLLVMMHPGQKYLLSHRSDPEKPVSENTLNKVITRLGYDGKLTSHGVRGTISTALNELNKYDPDIIEAQLSHAGEKDKDKDSNEKIRQAYNHARYIKQRRQMMQDWADMLENMGMVI